MSVLVVINDAPHATERPYNALRLATALVEDGRTAVRLFLVGDGVWCARKGQPVPEGGHDIEWMLRRLLAGGPEAAVCGTCMDARGITDSELIDGMRRSNLQVLKGWTLACERVLVF